MLHSDDRPVIPLNFTKHDQKLFLFPLNLLKILKKSSRIRDQFVFVHLGIMLQSLVSNSSLVSSLESSVHPIIHNDSTSRIDNFYHHNVFLTDFFIPSSGESSGLMPKTDGWIGSYPGGKIPRFLMPQLPLIATHRVPPRKRLTTPVTTPQTTSKPSLEVKNQDVCMVHYCKKVAMRETFSTLLMKLNKTFRNFGA